MAELKKTAGSQPYFWRVAPLFESVEALNEAGDIIGRLLADPVYRAHLAERGNRQVVMIGYADSNKSTGIVTSRWLLRQAQEAMVAACAAAGVRLQVFHGRGGSISGGGGRTDALVRSMPPNCLRGHLRVTEQGESINERYGLRPIALRTFEQGVSTVALVAAGFYGTEVVVPRWREAMALLASAARGRYCRLVHGDPAFRHTGARLAPQQLRRAAGQIERGVLSGTGPRRGGTIRPASDSTCGRMPTAEIRK